MPEFAILGTRLRTPTEYCPMDEWESKIENRQRTPSMKM
jgi:hypothetical protein